jgi:hypothetical protein
MAVKTGLALAGRRRSEPAELAGATFPGTSSRCPPVGLVGALPRRAAHPHTQRIRPITFDHAVAKGRDDVVLVHLNHRLVQMCLRLLRAEVWAQDDVKKLHRVTVRTCRTHASTAPPWSSSRGWSSPAATTIACTRN